MNEHTREFLDSIWRCPACGKKRITNLEAVGIIALVIGGVFLLAWLAVHLNLAVI